MTTNQRDARRVAIVAVTAMGRPLVQVAELSAAEVTRAGHLLAGMAGLGHVVRHRIVPLPPAPGTFDDFVGDLRRRFGGSVVDMMLRFGPNVAGLTDPAPDYLMPLWLRAGEDRDVLTGAGRLLGAGMEIVALRMERDHRDRLSPAEGAREAFAPWADALDGDNRSVVILPDAPGDELVVVARPMPEVPL
jgi:hypothetical protein